MNPLQKFKIPFGSLKEGIHIYNYKISKAFFAAKQSSQENGKVEIKLELDRRLNFMIFNFFIKGTVEVICDRCLNVIDLPISAEREMLIKFADEPNEEEEIIYLQHGAHDMDISDLIYEFIMLEIPYVKVKDCESEDYKDCNKKVLSVLDQEIEEAEEESLLAKALKDINLNKK